MQITYHRPRLIGRYEFRPVIWRIDGGADGITVANSAMQAIGCLGMRACDSNNCPVGIATQRKDLRNRLVIDSAAGGLQNFFEATVKLMKVMARACGHELLSGFDHQDLTTPKKDIADLTGVEYAGVGEIN